MTTDVEARYAQVRSVADHPALHEDGIRAAYEAVLRPGDTAVDGGAHAGKHTVKMAAAVGPSGHVAAFEPAAGPRARLEKTVEDHKLTQVAVHAHALSRPPARTETFLYFPDRPGVSGFERRTDDAGSLEAEELTVETATLDEMVHTGPVRFVKLDVEGAELDALNGAHRVLAEHHPVVHVEASYISWDAFSYGPEELLELAGGFGYDVIDLVGLAMHTVDALDASFRTAGVWDYLLVPRNEVGRDAWTAVLDHAERCFPGP